jgi:hypothetical protein
MQQMKSMSQHHRKRKQRFRRGQELIWKEQRRFLHVLWELKEMKKVYHVLSNQRLSFLISRTNCTRSKKRPWGKVL